MKETLLVQFSQKYKLLLEEFLRSSVQELETPSILKDAMQYSLEAGGKRIRPLLLFATLKAFGKNPLQGLETAAAIEMIHTYSLIHDDLPSMDDDDLRRGKPTNHKVFGEAMAILAGDALLTYSFQMVGKTSSEHATAETKLQLIMELAKAAGAEGMVGGQVADMNGEGKDLTLTEMEYIHIHKTGKLLAYSVIAGAILSGATKTQLQLLTDYAFHLGLAFQIQDDILDLEGNQEIIGKPVGSDTNNQKSTYPSLLTLDGAKKALNQHITEADQLLKKSGLDIGLLNEITLLIASRDH
ncbi:MULTISPECIES: polyprenyl synthetase family protein [unclassified Bacillus (in: firmicutes)]|uniref:polyprenyl synthetase family protein n=1 Tax=unclassified Bacillus (in: firmicutes) TaxID=185979 RepID=UPI0008DFF691|nr:MULTISPECIES: farnesyl diphosphate synthase [unclassified Bacillus (in: firmicutes)]SFA96832.1 geranylgeranyl diphosphate synthase, type II [Bacillus sp. UNCCL13]SFQ80077.1 geranylgeranyl diphosphate synthase, type II [Bacillus sp. cl95]